VGLGNISRLAELHIAQEQNHKQKELESNHERRDFSIDCGVRDTLI
jgi:hypothetical protein